MRRSSIPAALVALAVAACGSAQTSSSSSSSSLKAHAARTTSRCAKLTTSYLRTEGATGHLEVTFALRNTSSESCRVEGYPATRLLDASGKALPMRVQRGHGFFADTMRPARWITLAPGGRARFGVSFVTNNEFAGAHTCRTAASAVAIMPGWTGARPRPVSLRRAPRISPCGDQLVVSPLYA
jgi:uncharacterized protein DUF4232